MNERYLFKAKRLDNGEWVQGNLIVIAKENCFICTGKIKLDAAIKDFIAPEMYKVFEDTICQCTGLKDKNGKLIWENDIMKYQWNGETRVDVVKYDAPMFSYENVIRWSLYQDEVIGNVFDNPELLESEM